MNDFLPKEVREGLEMARKQKLRKKSRLKVRVGDETFTIFSNGAANVGQTSLEVVVRRSGGGPFANALFAGNGIMGDSDPDAELEEVSLKLRPLAEALGGRVPSKTSAIPA